MKKLHAPNELFRIHGLREGMRAWEELRRLLGDSPHRPPSRRRRLRSDRGRGLSTDIDRRAEFPQLKCGPPGTRTLNQWIKSHLDGPESDFPGPSEGIRIGGCRVRAGPGAAG